MSEIKKREKLRKRNVSRRLQDRVADAWINRRKIYDNYDNFTK